MANTRGRPPVLDEQKKQNISTVLRMGGTRRLAASYVGCHVETIRRTAARDSEFAADIVRAEANSEMLHLGAIRVASKKNWRAAAWALERLYPNQYGKRNPATMTSEQVVEVVRQFAEVIVENVKQPKLRRTLQQRLRKLAVRLGKQVELANDKKKSKG